MKLISGAAVGCVLVVTSTVVRRVILKPRWADFWSCVPDAAFVCNFYMVVHEPGADCDELKAISLPLTGDLTVTLTEANAPCDNIAEGELEDFVIEGGALTLTGLDVATFSNVRFTVMDGASLIFDFDKTEFGPNSDFIFEDSFGEYMLEIMEGGYAEFSGEFLATGVRNYFSVFLNAGSLEFKSDAEFLEPGTNLFRDNTGKLRFRGNVNMVDAMLLGINNIGGTVRIAGDSNFENIGSSFDGADGAAVANRDDGIAIFDGTAVFNNVYSQENGGAVFNEGKMKFYSKARFFDNRAGEDGGAVYNSNGNLKFFGAVQMIDNVADWNGGALGVGGGGTVRFSRWVTVVNNTASGTGGAMVVGATNLENDGEPSSVEFRKPTKVRIEGNVKTETELGCNSIFVEEGSEVIGYPVDEDVDICEES